MAKVIFLLSHDLGDLIAIIDGRESLTDECKLRTPELREYLELQFTQLIENRALMQALSAHLPPDGAGQSRLPLLEAKLRELAHLAD